ncbi:anti-sigma B factor antagonist [Rhodovulum imhoffii]|uniref:Anti-sigma factor antagonist n=1 Tax=Rhodovulum imhoffii TaxID=365340 RepID=A0A2T5BUZ4_9RHOB|nr:STAS domain-containing protein [Rhodovulum imhoffii]MBK5934686.1 anti-anti-sigma factor [Rhodovulum imhoffii]PTN03338.1 anti-sigma B factor antagonist [Rhodovulum imhoffii]
MQLTTRQIGNTLIIRVAERRLDAVVSIRFKEQMREATADGPPRVILDLGNVTFLDSSGLGAVVGVHKLLGPARRLELAGITPNVGKVLQLTRMDSIFTIHRHIADAICSHDGAA